MPTHVHVTETANWQAGGGPRWIGSLARDWLRLGGRLPQMRSAVTALARLFQFLFAAHGATPSLDRRIDHAIVQTGGGA
jgi:hypothetical protein